MIDYGFDTSDDVQYEPKGLPVGTYKAMIVSEEQEQEGRGIVAEFEVLEGDFKGKKGKVWYLTKHTDPKVKNIAQQNIKRIADATGRPVTTSTPLKGRVLTIEVQKQRKRPDYTEIVRYHPEDHAADAPF